MEFVRRCARVKSASNRAALRTNVRYMLKKCRDDRIIEKLDDGWLGDRMTNCALRILSKLAFASSFLTANTLNITTYSVNMSDLHVWDVMYLPYLAKSFINDVQSA